MKNLLYIGNKLSHKGLNVTTIETLGTALEREGVTVRYASSKKNSIWRLLDMSWSVIRYKNQVSLVLIDTYSTSAFWYAFLVSQLCRLLGLFYVPILHGGNLPERLQKNPYLSRLIFKNAYRNVAPSKYLQSIFEHEKYTNVIHIPNTIDVQKYSFEQRMTSSPKILWVRAFAAIYNPKMAVDVLQRVQLVYPEATLCMVGPDKDGSMAITKEYAKLLGLEVIFTGGLTKEDWITLSRDYNVFINTTHFDNTPVSVMEVMALGLPVVSTNVGGIPFLLNDNIDAILVADNDAISMSEAVLQLAQHMTLAKKLTFNARKKVEELDWEVVKNQWFALFESCCRDLS